MDYNSEALMSAPADDICRMQVLEKRYNLKESFEHYNKQVSEGLSAPTGHIKARLINLFSELRALMKKKAKEEHDKIVSLLENNDIQSLRAAEEIIDDYLYDPLGLVKIDTKRQLGGNIRKRNKAQGWS